MNILICNENKFYLINRDSLSIIEKNKIMKRHKLKGIFQKGFYDEELQLIYIFYINKFEILNLNNMKSIFTTKIDGTSDIIYLNKVNNI